MALISKNGRIDASLFGAVSDSELLAIIDDLADENGWTTTIAVRSQLGESLDNGERSGVGSRLSWLRRYGWLEKGERVRVEADTPSGWRWSQGWRLSAMGHAIVENPKLSHSFETALTRLNPAQRVHATRELAESGARGPAEVRSALSRQWKRSLGR